MSSNIKVQRICQHCGKEFTAKTTVTKYCSDACAKRAYKDRKRNEKVQNSNIEYKKTVTEPLEKVKSKEFLTVKDVSVLLGCSKRTTYRLIERGIIKAVNLSERMTRVKRSEINKVLEPSSKDNDLNESIQFNVSDYYILNEVISKYKISRKALNEILRRNNICKIKKGKYTYVPISIIDSLFR